MLTIALVALAAGAALGAGVLHWLRLRGRRNLVRKDAAVAEAASDYLVKSGIQRFSVLTITLDDGRIVLLVESEPQKKLRFSSIIEHSLRDHVERAANTQVAQVYWRFPIVGARDVAAKLSYADAGLDQQAARLGPETEAMDVEDEGGQHIERHDAASQYEIAEVDWDHFQSHVKDGKADQGEDAAPKA